MFVDGVTRIGATLLQEARNAIFASVAQKAIRKVACSVYEHLLRLDLNFHLSRQTGGLTRAIDRGTKGISFLLTSMVFHILPTALEISLVCGILVSLLVCRLQRHARLYQNTKLLRLINTARNLLSSPGPPWQRIPLSPYSPRLGERSSESKQMLPTTELPPSRWTR
jgi:ABC-type multidrug transport system fused ATPase/permease subunit